MSFQNRSNMFIKRYYSRSNIVRNKFSSNEIRKTFINYFIQNNHKFIRSSPVVPFCDPSVVFVNAGMNQFKNVFLGKSKTPCDSAVNSQKCIRVGGKHNDLSIVGSDGYHHTYFEMLGNWSFGNYFKKEACEFAWNLLTGPFNINPSRLYVTYFGGDSRLKLSPDYECVDIWRNLGLPDNRILPFDCNDNFWEMGPTGPCGPCTEIHIDHLPQSILGGTTENRAEFVNAGHSSLTELWNIVFIEYDRNKDGTIKCLPQKHIDTGMGMERLTAILQNKISNYDTDLFMPIMHKIHKVTGSPAYTGSFDKFDNMHELNLSYRIIADHSRMITSCIADGMYPDQNYKLRRILRKVFRLSDKILKKKNLLLDLIPTVTIIFQEVYPEMVKNLPKILNIISHEMDLYKTLITTTSGKYSELLKQYPDLENFDAIDLPGFLPAYKELISVCNNFQQNIIPGDFVFKLYDTYGLNLDVIDCVAANHGLTVDKLGFQQCFANTVQKTKQIIFRDSETTGNFCPVISLQQNHNSTYNDFKYDFKYNENERIYEVEPLNSKILFIIKDNSNDSNKDETIYHIITDKSNFYYESGGQDGDIGHIEKLDEISHFIVRNVKFENDFIIHSGIYSDNNCFLNVGDNVKLFVDNEHRTRNIQHHTATHLLNSSVRYCTNNAVVYQKSSCVSENELKFELGILGVKLTNEMISNIEELVRKIIKSSTPIKSEIISAQEAYADNDIIIVPGEIYPENGLRLLTIENMEYNFISKELCCGTHAFNTIECEDFFITNVKQSGRNSYIINGVSGRQANIASKIGSDLLFDIKNIVEICITNNYKIDKELKITIKRLKQMLFEGVHACMPFAVKTECLQILTDVYKKVQDTENLLNRKLFENEIRILTNDYSNEYSFLIHFLNNKIEINDNNLLQIFKKLCKDKPIMLLFLSSHNLLKIVCYVPKTHVANNNMSTSKWINEICVIFNENLVRSQKEQRTQEMFSTKTIRIDEHLFKAQIAVALQNAENYAKQFFR